METRRFAEDLLGRIPSAGSAPGRPTQYRQQEREAAAFARKNAAFALLSDDEEDFVEPPPAPTTAPVPKATKKSLRKSRVRALAARILVMRDRSTPAMNGLCFCCVVKCSSKALCVEAWPCIWVWPDPSLP
jgi:hypothetical protein